METARLLSFGPYRFDPQTGQLWRGKQEVKLTPKAATLLRSVVARAGQVVTKEDLFQAVWPETVVSDAALTTCIQELRSALRDKSKSPRYLKTIHRRGFQFVGALQPLGLPESLTAPVPNREVERKLAAILSADVQGYSRLMGEDELATLRTLTAYRKVIDTLINQHWGRIVGTAGDSVLAEFASVVDAARCAVDIQTALGVENAKLPSARQMTFRIGINVGDVMVEGEQIYGDSVNIAARLEALAEGGGICISRSVYEQIKNKIALAYEYMGERTVKNIAEPVAVYRVLLSSPSASSPVSGVKIQIPSSLAPSPRHPTPTLVSRDSELAQLQAWFDKALRGERQVVFVSGEPGIGKTTVVEAFLGQVSGDERLRIGRGQCVEHYGVGEAYLPVLEALGRLCREEDGKEVIALLRQHAPTWLVQLPSILSTVELEELQRRTAGMTRERMLRELAEVIEALTAERPLILWLEDLHWSDVSTLDWLAYVARRREAARLFIIGTYRPIEVLTREHPLRAIKQELQVHGQCEEVALDFLREEAIAEYLAQRFEVGAVREPPLRSLTHLIHQRTDGNPLFMVNVVNDLIAQGLIVQTNGKWELRGEVRDRTLGTPVNLRQLIEQQLVRIGSEARKVLEVASVVGAEFSAAAVAAGAEQSTEVVEAQCDSLAQREQFLRARGATEWPDGTVAARYGFVHALYQEVLYEQISASRCIRLHRQIGEREEQAYGEQAREIAAELAVHFERGRGTTRAVRYRQHAGQTAIRRSAYQEAIAHFTKGLELLKAGSDSAERLQQELVLQTLLGSVFTITKDQAAPETGKTFRRAYELCQYLGDSPQIFSTLAGLRRFYTGRGELHTAHELAQRMLTVAQRAHDPALLVEAHHALGNGLCFQGEFVAAQAQVEQGIAVHDLQQHRSLAFVYGFDPGVQCRNFAAHVLWLLGYPEQALQRSPEALTLAKELAHPPSQAIALNFATFLHQLHREGRLTQTQAEELIRLSAEQGFALFLAYGTTLRGWALTEQGQGEEGIVQIHQGLTALRASGRELGLSHCLALLAEACGKVGQPEEGLTVLAEALALVHKNGDRWYEAELYRLKGELTLQGANQKSKGKTQKSKITDPRSLTPDPQGEAEACFLKAIDIARKQQAKSLELRASMSLARLWQSQGKQKEAYKMLSEIYGWFTEGFDTKDLQEAKALLESLESRV